MLENLHGKKLGLKYIRGWGQVEWILCVKDIMYYVL